MATYKGKTYGREPEASEEYLPLRPPEWIPDASAPACMAATDLGVACGRPFDAFLEWRHHCRFCGRVVCGACSRRKMLLPGERWAPYAEADFDFSEPRRVCNYCCETLKPFQKRWAQRVARSHRPAMGTEDETLRSGQDKRAKFPTSKPHISAVFRSFRLIFGRAIISRNGLEAWMLFPERARAEHSR